MYKKIRVLFTIPNFKTAGSQYVLLSIINKLDKDLFEIFVGVETRLELIPDSIPVKNRVQILLTGNTLKDAYRFSKTLRKKKIQLVHSWDYKSQFVEAIACRLAWVPYIYTKKNDAWSKRWFLKSLLSRGIAYNNPDMEQRFFNHFLLRHKVRFIPHGIDTNHFKPTANKKENREVFNLCCIGNMGENKNQLFLVNALKSLPQNVHLNLYGHGDKTYLRGLKTLIHQEQLEERVHIHNFIKNLEVPGILQKQHVFVLASKKEGLPVCVIEALACGVPVLCSDSGGGSRYIFKDGLGGAIFDLNNMQQFIAQINLFYTDTNYLLLKRREAIALSKQFDLNKEVKSYETLYQQLT